MKKVLIVLMLFFSFLFGDSALLLHKGWQLIGSTSKIDDMSIFDGDDVEQVWHFDASTQKWRGYSPFGDIQEKITQKGYAKIDSLQSWHGFWVKSKRDWALHFADDERNSDENITLKKGWNLISLPVNSVVSPQIFDDATLWKYASNDGWEFFEKGVKENYPTISHITNSDGIWVKSDKDQTISTATNAARLHNFETIEDVKAYVRDMLLTNVRPVCGYYPLTLMRDGGVDTQMVNGGALEAPSMAKDSAPAASDDASGTNLQEQGVDESDIVKHDDRYIYYVSEDPKNFVRHFVNITTFENISNGNLNPVKQISIGGHIDSIYLVGDRLISLSNYGTQNGKPYRPDGSVDDEYRNSPSIVVDIFDVSDIENVKSLSSYKINGSINSSRVVNDKLFLITSFNPYISSVYPYKIYVDAPECKEYFAPRDDVVVPVSTPVSSSRGIVADDYKKYAKCYGLQEDKDGRFYRVDYDRPKISYEKLLPFVQKDKEDKKLLVSPERFYAPGKKDQDPTITTVSEFDIPTANLEKSTTILGYAKTIYASKNALYLVSNKYPVYMNFDSYRQRSVIYKFLLNDDISYKAAGFINGNVLNQFSLSEYQGILRVATSEGNSWQNNTKNSIYTLGNVDDLLFIKGTLSGLGKEGEVIRSVRFMGDKGYVVTFKQTDPFYTIDLSDPSNPKKAGELKIYGYSSYLHPIDKNHILGIGRDATPNGQIAGLKMELFDISDFTNPLSVDSYSFGNSISYTDLENNHKALAYRDSDKLFGFAYTSGDRWDGRDQLGVFQILNDTIKAYKPITTPVSDKYSYHSYDRGLIFDFAGKTYIAYFSNGKIAYDLLDNLKGIR